MLGSDEGVVLVSGAVASPWEGSTLLSVAPDGGGTWVLTGDQWGPFSVEAHVLDAAPGDPDESWEDVTEVDVAVRDGLHICELVNQDLGVGLDVPRGSCRLRVSARGRGAQATESYLIEVWPTTVQEPPVDLRETSRHARALRAGPRPALAVEGEVEGLAASARIGRDADRSTGARTLRGRTSEVTVARRIPQTRARIFRRFRTSVPLSHHVPSWTCMSGPDGDGVGATTYAYAGDGHPDQLSGRGYLRHVLVEESSPARHVRRTSWLVSVDGGRSLDEHVPLFEPDTTVTVTYEQAKDANGQAWTTVTVHHGDVPLEWADDLRTWWAYQLAFLDAELAEDRG